MPTDTTAGLLAELTHHGIELQAWGNRLRYRPRSALTPELAARVKARKAQLLTLLGVMAFGDVCAGWTPTSWAQELRRKADRGDTYRPDIADYYRRWAGDIERRLEEQA